MIALPTGALLAIGVIDAIDAIGYGTIGATWHQPTRVGHQYGSAGRQIDGARDPNPPACNGPLWSYTNIRDRQMIQASVCTG